MAGGCRNFTHNWFPPWNVVTWIVPEFDSMFLAFLSLIQILLVAAIGTALSGLTAVIARLVGKKAA